MDSEKDILCVGVDISSKMLEQAREKDIYTELHCTSLRSYAQRNSLLWIDFMS